MLNNLNNFKKTIYIILFFFIITSVIVFIKKNNKNNFNKEIQEEFIKNSVNITTSEPIYNNNNNEYQYILKDFQGKLAVFEKDKKDPEMIFDVLIESLPEIDIIELKKGLKIKDEEELNARIEDFIS
ncbi:MAG: hypothetical protein J6C55_01520 [Oscillospiraceae bacterium]|nr:hypothetical protein [Oscillospiraceae bacterium]